MRGLEGIKVVELTSYVAAPACPRILGEMGATIFKIEPASGDEYRTNGPGFGMEKTDTDDPAFDYASMNRCRHYGHKLQGQSPCQIRP